MLERKHHGTIVLGYQLGGDAQDLLHGSGFACWHVASATCWLVSRLILWQTLHLLELCTARGILLLG